MSSSPSRVTLTQFSKLSIYPRSSVLLSAVTGLKYSLSPGLRAGESIDSVVSRITEAADAVSLHRHRPAERGYDRLPLRRHLFSAYKRAEMGDEQTAGDFEQRIRHARAVYNGLREKPTSISIMMTSTDGTQPFVTFASISEMAKTSSSAVNAPKVETIIGLILYLSPH